MLRNKYFKRKYREEEYYLINIRLFKSQMLQGCMELGGRVLSCVHELGKFILEMISVLRKEVILEQVWCLLLEDLF